MKTKKQNSNKKDDLDIGESDDLDIKPKGKKKAVAGKEKALPEILEIEDSRDEDGPDGKTGQEEDVIIKKSKIILAKKLLENIAENNDKLLKIFAGLVSSQEEERISISQTVEATGEGEEDDEAGEGGKIIEGVFDGENMIGPDGKQYSVPANYASKSKLVEGDILKLIITARGAFVYKQIGPIERLRLVGTLEKGSDGNFSVNADGKKWRVLQASVTFFKGNAGDETVILVPKTGESQWAAVENIIRKKE